MHREAERQVAPAFDAYHVLCYLSGSNARFRPRKGESRSSKSKKEQAVRPRNDVIFGKENPSLRVRLLPSAAGRESQLQSLTSFVVNDRLAVDGGSIGFALLPEQIGTIRHVIVTHAHSDHTASLPIYIAEAYTALDGPISVYAGREVVAALRDFTFNDHVWPDFEKIPLSNGAGPTVRFVVLEPKKTVQIAGISVTPVPVNHIVPTMGLLVESDGTAVMFTSDTYSTDEIWDLASKLKDLKAVFVDVSFPNELGELAAASKHLTPELLAIELGKLKGDARVFAVHIKPSNRDAVIRQLHELGDPHIAVGEIDKVYEW
jgi:ribonuclease BN (tRNA processing enzyme)